MLEKKLKKSLYQREWNKRNPDKLKIYRERSKEYRKEWGRKNKDKVSAALKKYLEKNSDKVRDRVRNFHFANKERRNERQKELANIRKIRCLIRYSSDPPFCICCNEKEIKFLSIDHINGGGNKQKKELGGSGDKLYRWIIKSNFPSLFQTLCFNCNQAKGIYGNCPHKLK